MRLHRETVTVRRVNAPGWNPCKPYAEDAPVIVKRYAKVTNDAKPYPGECLCALAGILIPASGQRYSPPDNYAN